MISNLFANRRFLCLWSAQLFATLGVELYNVAVMVTIFERSGSAFQTALAFLLRMAPSIVLGPVTGVIVDRYSRKHVMVAAHLLRAGLIVGSIYYIDQIQTDIWSMYFILIGLAVADVFYVPAQLALLPTLIDAKELVQANSALATTNHAMSAIAFLVGALISAFNLRIVLSMDILLFLCASFMLSIIGGRRAAAPLPPASSTLFSLHELREGWRYLRQHRLARALIVMEVMEYWPHGAWTPALMLAYTKYALHAGAEMYGVQSAIFFAGQLIGSFLSIALARRLSGSAGKVIIINSLINAVAACFYANNGQVSIAILICFLFGPPTALRDILQDSLLQSSIDDDKQGRVYATRQMLVNCNYLCASMVFAWIADQAPIQLVFWLSGILYFVVVFYAYSQPFLRKSSLYTHTRPTVLPEAHASPLVAYTPE